MAEHRRSNVTRGEVAGLVFARLLFVFINLAQGISFLYQRPTFAPQRDTLSKIPLPVWVYGLIFLVGAGVILALGIWRWGLSLSHAYLVGMVPWLLLSLTYIPPILSDPKQMLWGGACAFLFIGAMHGVASVIEGQRYAGRFEHR